MCSEARFCITLSLITFITVQSPIFTFRAWCWGSRSRGSFIPDVSLFSVFCFCFFSKRRCLFEIIFTSVCFFIILFFVLLFVIQDNYFYFKVSSRTQLCIFFIAKLLKNSEQQDFKKVFVYLFFLLYFCFLVKIK